MNYIASTIQRYRTLRSNIIYELPVLILMPHSSCNCRCIMCDIWKGNKNLKQLTEKNIEGLLTALKKFNTKLVLLSGGEALLHENLFLFCSLLKRNNIKIHLLTTGLTLQHHAENILKNVDEIIISLDGPEQIHNAIRRIPTAYQKLREGVKHLKAINPKFRITARSVVQKENFRKWRETIDSAKEIGFNQISFLPADVSSYAFNREELWDESRQDEVRILKSDLPELKTIIEELIVNYSHDFANHYIAESPEKIRKIYAYYAAIYSINQFPYKQCNAPWVSTVIEADGTVRHCFFHESMGNIHDESVENIINNSKAINFRKKLNVYDNDTCKKCVCYLNLKPTIAL